MSVIESVCPEPGCKAKTSFWAGGYLQHETQHNEDRACPEHREKYRKLREEWEEQSERLRRLCR